MVFARGTQGLRGLTVLGIFSDRRTVSVSACELFARRPEHRKIAIIRSARSTECHVVLLIITLCIITISLSLETSLLPLLDSKIQTHHQTDRHRQTPSNTVRWPHMSCDSCPRLLAIAIAIAIVAIIVGRQMTHAIQPCDSSPVRLSVRSLEDICGSSTLLREII